MIPRNKTIYRTTLTVVLINLCTSTSILDLFKNLVRNLLTNHVINHLPAIYTRIAIMILMANSTIQSPALVKKFAKPP